MKFLMIGCAIACALAMLYLLNQAPVHVAVTYLHMHEFEGAILYFNYFCILALYIYTVGY